MARIAGINLPDKPIKIALTYIFGIGKQSALEICQEVNISLNKKSGALTEEEINSLREIIETKYTVESDLRRIVSMNIKKLKDMGCYRGLRHRKNLPVRGQNTRTNSRTRKGPSKTVANKKK